MAIEKHVVKNEKFGSCIRLENEVVEVLISLDYGPRIRSCRRIGGANILLEDPERNVSYHDSIMDRYYYPGATWYTYGGHRLWVSPETSPETYFPDNEPVEYEWIDGGVLVQQPHQKENGVKLSMSIILDESRAELKILHWIENTGADTKRLAPWAITAMAPSGTEIVPLVSRDAGFLPNRSLALWSYTDLADERLFFGKEYFTLTQRPEISQPFKMGTNNEAGWAAYLHEDTLFVKRFGYQFGKAYPDFDVSYETYANNYFLEMETLGNMQEVGANEVVCYEEHWSLFVETEGFDARNEDSVKTFAEKIEAFIDN